MKKINDAILRCWLVLKRKGCLRPMGRTPGFSSSYARGMSLVEVLAASVILSIMVSSVLMLYTQSWTASQKDNEKLLAAHLAQFVLEEWLADHDYERVKDKMENIGEESLTLDNDEDLKEIWDDLLDQLANHPDYQFLKPIQFFTPIIELSFVDESAGQGFIRVSVTIISKNQQLVTLHGIKPYG